MWPTTNTKASANVDIDLFNYSNVVNKIVAWSEK